MRKTLTAGLCCIFLQLTPLEAAVPGLIAIKNARIHTGAGATIAKGTVVVRDGLIEAVGENVPVPAGAWEIDGSGLSVYPGLIDALSRWGLPSPQRPGAPSPGARSSSPPGPGPLADPASPQTAAPSRPAQGPEDRPSNASWLQAQDLINPSERSIVSARSAGFTTAVTFPTSGIFAGQGAVINLAGERAGSMVVQAPAGLYHTFTTRGSSSYPGSLMGVFAYIRQVYLDADHYQAAKAAYEAQPLGTRRVDYDRALEGVLRAPRVLLPATTAIEIRRMLSLAAELKRTAVLYGGHEAYAAVDALRESGAPVLVDLKWPERSREADPERRDPLRVLEIREKSPGAPAALAKAGVRFAFFAGGVDRPEDVRAALRKALSAGLSEEQALRALTLSAAEIYDIANRLGSLEKGKIANLTVTDGNLFAESTKVKFVLVDGVKYEPEPEPSPNRPRNPSEVRQ